MLAGDVQRALRHGPVELFLLKLFAQPGNRLLEALALFLVAVHLDMVAVGQRFDLLLVVDRILVFGADGFDQHIRMPGQCKLHGLQLGNLLLQRPVVLFQSGNPGVKRAGGGLQFLNAPLSLAQLLDLCVQLAARFAQQAVIGFGAGRHGVEAYLQRADFSATACALALKQAARLDVLGALAADHQLKIIDALLVGGQDHLCLIFPAGVAGDLLARIRQVGLQGLVIFLHQRGMVAGCRKVTLQGEDQVIGALHFLACAANVNLNVGKALALALAAARQVGKVLALFGKCFVQRVQLCLGLGRGFQMLLPLAQQSHILVTQLVMVTEQLAVPGLHVVAGVPLGGECRSALGQRRLGALKVFQDDVNMAKNRREVLTQCRRLLNLAHNFLATVAQAFVLAADGLQQVGWNELRHGNGVVMDHFF